MKNEEKRMLTIVSVVFVLIMAIGSFYNNAELARIALENPNITFSGEVDYQLRIDQLPPNARARYEEYIGYGGTPKTALKQGEAQARIDQLPPDVRKKAEKKLEGEYHATPVQVLEMLGVEVESESSAFELHESGPPTSDNEGGDI